MKRIVSNLNISKIERLPYRKDINGLRALSVLAVVLFHADFHFFGGGWLGVDVFFVISGYLISNIIISELNNNDFSLKSFYIRRVRRILPALYSVVVLCIPFVYWLFTPKATVEFIKSSLSATFFYANLFFQNLDFYNAEPTKLMPLLHTWSLAIEEQFYLFFPLICILLFRYVYKYFLSSLAALFFLSLYLNSTTGDLIKFYQITFRAWELILGSLIMIVSSKISIKNLNYLGLLIVVSSFIFFDDSMLTLNSIEPKLIVSVGTSFILISKGDGLISKFLLENKISQLFGNVSYSLYLLHQPFFAFLSYSQLRYGDFLGEISSIELIPILVFISYLSWRYIELTFKNTDLKNLTIGLTIIICIILIFCLLGFFSNGYDSRYSSVPEDIMFYSNNPIIFPTTDELNEFNDWCQSSDKKRLYIMGDSHAYTFAYTLIKDFKYLSCDYELVIYSGDAGRCLLSQQSDIVGYVGWCTDEGFNNFIENVKEDEPVVIAIGRFDNWINKDKGSKEVKCEDCNYLEIFDSRTEEIAKKSEAFYIFNPVPTFPVKIAESYLFKKIPLNEEVTIKYSDWSEYINYTLDYLDQINGDNIIRIKSEEVFCDIQKNICYSSKQSELLYSDDNHLTVKGNTILIEELLNSFNR